jgi:hypothetical protein
MDRETIDEINRLFDAFAEDLRREIRAVPEALALLRRDFAAFNKERGAYRRDRSVLRLPAFSMGRPQADVADRDALEEAMGPSAFEESS